MRDFHIVDKAYPGEKFPIRADSFQDAANKYRSDQKAKGRDCGPLTVYRGKP